MGNKIIDFDVAKRDVLDKKLKKEHAKELTRIALTSNNLSEYAVMSALFTSVEAAHQILNDPAKRARCKQIYRR